MNWDNMFMERLIPVNEETSLRVKGMEFNADRLPQVFGELVSHVNCRCSVGQKDPIKRVIFNNPATIVFWKDGTKTVVKCGVNDIYDHEKGLAMAIAKKYLGNKGNYNNIFKKYLKEEELGK